MNSKPHLLGMIRATYARRHEPLYAVLFADLYWRMLLLVALGVVIIACVIGAWQSVAIIDEFGSGDSPDAASKILLNTAQLNATLQAIQSRSTNFQAAATLPSIADPSH